MELRRKLEALGSRRHPHRARAGLRLRRAAGRRPGGRAMSLATRLSAFFLVALAVVLAGFSGTLYLLARTYLVRQLDERLQHALDTLEASVDIEPGGLEWEPADRQMTLGVEPGRTRCAGRSATARGAWWTVRPTRVRAASPPTGRRRPGPRTRRTPRPSARSPAGGWRRGGCGWRSCCGKAAGTRTTSPATRCSIRRWCWSSAWRRPRSRRR